MQVKEIERTANVAWSPIHVHPIYLAAGTAAQQLDASFSTSAALEIYAVNLADTGNDLALAATVKSDHRFHKLTWGTHGSSSGTLVGGCDGGVIEIFDTSKLLQNEEGLVSRHQKHSGAVRALDFNRYQNNLLASGATDSEIFIWDLNNPATPMAAGSKVQPPEDLTSLAWNNQVQHILATSFPSRCVVWDLRKSDPIIKLSDTSARLKWSDLSWNPDVATQLCLASEEDQSPFIQLWDLRFATSPVKVLEGHQKGVLSVSWCHQDTEMLLSCGKDNRILCWNPNTTYQGGELICEMTSPNQWNFDVSWCPRNPALFSKCSFDGRVSVCSVVGGPQQPQTSTKIADSFPGMELYAQAPLPMQSHTTSVDLKKPPKWLKRPNTARFGFGGKLVVVEQRQITLCQVTSEPGLVARANLLDGALRNDSCSDYCCGKVAASTDDDERALWSFIHASFSPVPREEYLTLLGFHRQDIADKLGQLRLRNGHADKLATLGRSTDTESDLEVSDEITESRNSLFGVEGSPARSTGDLSNSPGRQPVRVPRSYKISTTDDVDGLICESLLLGDIVAAVELCVEDSRWADAMILAMSGGSDLLAKTQHRYLQENPGCLSKLIAAAVTEDWTPVILNCDVSSWKEALVAALTHSNDEFPTLCQSLGERLDPRFAQLCFLCAGNLNLLVEAWLSFNKAASPDNLQDLIEVIMLMKRAIELRGRSVEISGRVAELLSRYAIILASEGNLEMALAYLETSQDEGMAFLRDRIYRAAGFQQQQPQQPKANLQPSQRNAYGQNQTGYAAQKPSTFGYQAQPEPARNYQAPFSQPMYQNTPASIGQPSNYGGSPSTFPNLNNPMAPPPAEPIFNPNNNIQRQSPALSSGLTSRTKHVLDASVVSAPSQQTFYPSPNMSSTPYGLQNNPSTAAAPTPYNFQTAATSTNPASYSTPTPVNTAPSYQGFQPLQSANPAPTPTTAFLPQQPPGWNDPPPLSNRPPKPKKEVPQQELITSPLLGGPEPPVNGAQQMMNPYQPNQYQHPGNMNPPNVYSAAPPPTGAYPPPGQVPSSHPPQNSYPPPPSSYPPPSQTPNSYTPALAPTSSYPPPTQTPNSYPQTMPPTSSYPPPTQTPNSYPPAMPPTSSYPPPTQTTNSYPQTMPPASSYPPSAQAPNSFPPPPPSATSFPPPSTPTSRAPVQANNNENFAFTSPGAGVPPPFSRPPSQPSFPVTNSMPPVSSFPVQQQPSSQFGQPSQPPYTGHQSFPPSVPYQQPNPATGHQIQQQAPVRKPLPEEHIHLQTVLEELKNRCATAATNPPTKRKLDEVSKKFESLYDTLAEGSLSNSTLQNLHAIAQRVQNGDYTGGLAIHTQLASGPDFAQIAPFMPGIKVLLQTALQLQVYL